MWIALLAWSPPPKNLQKSVIGEAYKIGPSFIAVPMMMSGSLYKEIGGMATGQEGVAMVRVWHQGWIFGVIKVYIVLVAFLFYWPFCHWPFWFLAFLKIGQMSLAFWHIAFLVFGQMTPLPHGQCKVTIFLFFESSHMKCLDIDWPEWLWDKLLCMAYLDSSSGS